MKPEELVPLIATLGFGLQQFSQMIMDPLASVLITVLKHWLGEQRPDGTKGLPCGITDVDAKKTIIGLASFGLGYLIAATGIVRVLETSGVKGFTGWDTFITALTISAGTEGVNSVVKLVQYVKDAVKTRTPPSVAQGSPAPQSPQGSVAGGS